MKITKNIAVIAVLLLAAAYQYLGGNGQQPTGITTGSGGVSTAQNNTVNNQQVIQRIREAADNPDAKFWTTVQGEVIKNLKDDTKGSQHQKFLIKVSPDITLLVAHNIDLAPRVPVSKGDRITLHGEYAWNSRGGVLHWTHHDPKGRREGGWIEANGKRYK